MSKSFGDLRDDLIWRSAGSGSRATNAAKVGKKRSSQAGDITATDSRATVFIQKFLVECKSYKDLKLEGLFWRSSAGPISICVDDPIVQAKQHGKWPMLILKQNQRTPVIIVHRSIAKVVANVSGIAPVVTFVRGEGPALEVFSVFSMPDFIEYVDASNFIKQVPVRA